MKDVKIYPRLPTVEEYLRLAESVGWQKYVSRPTTTIALENSIFGVVAESNDKIIGTGRIVGDRASFYYIQDVMVEPDAQNQGVGRLILTNLMTYLYEYAPKNAFVGLFAASGKESFYEQFGFSLGHGMSLYIEGDSNFG